MAITIETEKLNLIKGALGYPTETADFLLTDEQIKDICVEPALRQYFAKFPLILQEELDISFNEELIVDFHDSFTYGVVDARITHQEYTDFSGGFNSFIYLASYNQQVANKNFGRKGYNPNSLTQANSMAYQALRSKSNTTKAIRIRVDIENRHVIAYSNRAGKLLINWAMYSGDFTDVRFNYIQDVIELCQGHLLKHAARTMGIFQNTNMPLNINYDFLNSEGDALLTKITEKWDQIAGAILMKL